jgi:predicted ATPase/DNA-binding SARP family transcriptional activator
MPLRVALAGQVGIEAPGGAFVDTTGLGRLGRLALAYLVCERHRPVPRDELAEVLWGENLPRTWETSLRVVVSKLRAWLAGAGLDRANALVSAFGCYQLALPAEAVVDVEQAAGELEAARRALAAGDGGAGRAHAAAAADAAGKEFLPGVTGAWAEQQQTRLRELRVEALETLSAASAAAGDPARALAAAEEAVALEPMRESAHMRVVAAHAAAGNRGAALRAYQRLRDVLAEELGVSPSAQTEAAYLVLLQDEPAPPARPAARLPAPASPFVGREAELDVVAGLVRHRRLVSVLGTGGLGKTRLALEVVARAAPEFADGAAMVALSELPDGSDAAAVAAYALAALGVAEGSDRPALGALVAALSRRHLVLLVDNCEHVVTAAAEVVATLLESCPELTVLATSREPLRVPGELTWRIPPLGAEDARRLLVDRVAAAGGGVEPSTAFDAAADEVCRRLDGIPLAIELAAARTDVLSLPEVAARLDDRFRLLTRGARTAPPRHQTLRRAIDWTYESLTPAEQALLGRLAVFAGAFTLGDAAEVAGDGSGDELLDRLSALVARSLVLSEGTGSGPSRYRLLETIRAYAAEKLEASGGGPPARERLLAWAAAVAEEAELHLDGPAQAAWLDRLDAEHANLRAALAVDPGSVDALRLATALGRFWEIRGHLHEGRGWLRTVLAANAGAPPLVRARAHNAAALLAQRQGDYAAARSRLEESLAIREREGDRLGSAVALHGLGNVAALRHDLGTARDRYERSLAIGRELGDVGLVAAALDNLGWVAHSAGDFAGARSAYEEALAVRREMGDEHGAALVSAHLGDLAYEQGDYRRAADLHRQSLDVRAALGDRAGRADSLATLAHLSMHEGHLAAARAQLEESLAIRRDLGDQASLPGTLAALADVALLAGDLAEADARLDEAAAAATAARDQHGLAHVLVHRGRVDRLGGRAEDSCRRYVGAKRAAGDLGRNGVTAEWLEGVGVALAARGDARGGALLLGAADALRTAIGSPVPPHERPVHDRDVAEVKAALGDGAFAASWRAGHALDLPDALAFAVLHLEGAGRTG